MDVSTHTTTISIATADTVGTTQTISCGFEPKAIIAFATGNSSATDSLAGGAVHGSFGVATGTADRASVAFMSTNAAAAVNDGRIGRNDALLCQVLGNGSVGSLLDLSAKDSSGYTVIIDDQFTVASRVSLFSIGGDDITNTATGWLTAPTSSGSIDITSLTFQPDFVIFFASAMDTDANFASNARSSLMIGAATATRQRVTATAQGPEANADSQSRSYSYDGECIAIMADTPTAIGCRASFTQFLSNGFRLNFLEAGTAYRVGFLAIKGGQWRLDDFLSSTTLSDTIAKSGFGFSPAGGMAFSHGAGKSTQDTVQSPGRMSVGAWSSATERVSQAYLIEDAQATTDNYRGIEHDAVVLRINDTGSLDGLVDISSVDGDGITFIQDDADSSQTYVWYWAVGENASGNQTVNASLGTLTLAGISASVVVGSVEVSASVGTLTLSGLQASVVAGSVSVNAGIGALVIAGLQGTVTNSESVNANVGALVLSGQQASIAVGEVIITANVGQLAISGLLATVTSGAVSISGNVGSLTLSGLQASVVSGSVSISAGIGTLTLAGYQATIVDALTVSANVGTLTLNGLQASVTPGSVSISASIGQLSIVGIAATITTGASIVDANVGSLALVGLSASVVVGEVAVSASVGVLVLASQQASVVPSEVSISASVGQLVVVGIQATITVGEVSITASVGVLVLSGQPAAIVAGSVSIVANVGALTLTGLQAEMQVASNVVVNAGVGVLILAGLQATIAGRTLVDWTITTTSLYTWTITSESQYVWSIEDSSQFSWTIETFTR